MSNSCDPMEFSIPGFPVHHQLLELAQTHAYWVSDAIKPSHLLSSSSPPVFSQSFPASGSFPMSLFLASGGQSIGTSASASALTMNTQGWFPFRLTGLISLQSKGLSKVFSNTSSKTSILWHSAFFMVQISYPYMSEWVSEGSRTVMSDSLQPHGL